MSLLRSFTHNVLLHPLMFVRDLAEQAGLPGIATALSRLHDTHEFGGGGLQRALQPEPELADTLPPPPQEPWTPEAEALTYRPVPPIPPPPPEEPLAGSIEDRMRRAARGLN